MPVSIILQLVTVQWTVIQPAAVIQASVILLPCGVGNWNGSKNTAVGHKAVGSYAMVANKASFGTGIGEFALTSNTTGGGNTVVGSNALVSNTTGAANTSIGTNTMFYNITGGSNTVVGYQAMLNNDSSSGNTAIGRQAMFSHRGLNGNNTAVGRESMQFDSIGFTLQGIVTLLLDGDHFVIIKVDL